MGLFKYSQKFDDSARSQVHDVDASYKDMGQVLRAVKYKGVAEAQEILEDCIAKRKAIQYKRHNTGMGHRSELGGLKGRYPKKEAKVVLKMLKEAKSNAVSKGLDEEKLMVRHACAYKQNTQRRHKRFFATGHTLGYGKQAMFANYETCRAELTLVEKRVLGKGPKVTKIPSVGKKKVAVKK
jgi:large subunit ribosomal protein L22